MTNSRWVDEWMRAWRSLPETAGANPWVAMLDHFTQSHPATYEQSFSAALDRLTEQSRAFLDLGQKLASSESGGWQASVFEYLDETADRLRDPSAAARAFGGLSPLDYWQQFAGHGEEPTSRQQSPVAQLEALLRMPGLGITREHQELFQELSRLWLGYEQAYGEYAAYCIETARQSVERLRERLKTEFSDGDGPSSIRALYYAWVACSEEVYAERVATADYMKLHGRLVNALMAYRRQAGKIMDEWANAANLPTREEVDALHHKLKDARQALQETRREFRALEARVGETPRRKPAKKSAGKKATKKKATKKKATKKKATKKKATKKKATKKKGTKKKGTKKKGTKKKGTKKTSGKKTRSPKKSVRKK